MIDFPQEGGSFVRNPDGSLEKTEGTSPAPTGGSTQPAETGAGVGLTPTPIIEAVADKAPATTVLKSTKAEPVAAPDVKDTSNA